MKNKLSLIITIVSAVLIFSNSVFAQSRVGSVNTEIGLEEAQKLGKLPKGFPVDRYRKVPEGCPKNARPYITIRNASTGTFPTAMLMSKLNTNPYLATLPLRKYGDKGPDRWFGDSFALGSCKICAATISAEVENEGGDNDGFHVWLSPEGTPNPENYRATLKSAVSYAGNPATNPKLWETSDAVGAVKIVSMDLPVAQINQHIFSTSNAFLDAIVWDDTKVNSMQLVVWR